jgi:hypothetical protein
MRNKGEAYKVHDSGTRADLPIRRHQVRRPGGPTTPHKIHGVMALGPGDRSPSVWGMGVEKPPHPDVRHLELLQQAICYTAVNPE